MGKRAMRLDMMSDVLASSPLLRLVQTTRQMSILRSVLGTASIFLLLAAVRAALPISLANANPTFILTPAAVFAACLFGWPYAVTSYMVGIVTATAIYLDASGHDTLPLSNQISVLMTLSGTAALVLLADNLTRLLLRALQLVELARESDDYTRLRLRELHHRIKNDLMGMVSTVRLMSRFQRTDEARSALNSVESRILALARVSARLEPGDTGSVIDTETLILALVDDFREQVGRRPITVRLGRMDNVALPQDTAAPLGLVLNEAVTNALKHAFPDDRAGCVTVSFTAANNLLKLVIEDDGIGIPVPLPRDLGLGQRLMHGLAAQVSGSYFCEPRPGPDNLPAGTTCTLMFPLPVV